MSVFHVLHILRTIVSRGKLAIRIRYIASTHAFHQTRLHFGSSRQRRDAATADCSAGMAVATHPFPGRNRGRRQRRRHRSQSQRPARRTPRTVARRREQHAGCRRRRAAGRGQFYARWAHDVDDDGRLSAADGHEEAAALRPARRLHLRRDGLRPPVRLCGGAGLPDQVVQGSAGAGNSSPLASSPTRSTPWARSTMSSPSGSRWKPVSR
jgi:hypothetical protein